MKTLRKILWIVSIVSLVDAILFWGVSDITSAPIIGSILIFYSLLAIGVVSLVGIILSVRLLLHDRKNGNGQWKLDLIPLTLNAMFLIGYSYFMWVLSVNPG